jgi:hypothetical protein
MAMMLIVRLLVVVLLSLVLVLPTSAQDEMVDGGDTPAQTDAPPAGEEPTSVPPTLQPTAIPPTPVPTLAPTAVPGPGAILLSDNFDDPSQARLPVASGAPERSLGYIDGQYEIRNGDPDPGGVVGVRLPGTYTDSTIAVDARVVGGPDNPRRIILECRGAPSGQSSYRLRVYPDRQRFQIERLQGRQAVTLLELPTTAVRPDSFNHIEFTCAGTSLSATINGVAVGQTQDSTFTTGEHGIGLAGSGAVARFDNLVVTQR